MSPSQFMDKQIMGTQGGGDFLELLNPGEGHPSNGAAAGIFPSYDFQPIRRAGSPSPPQVGLDGGGAWRSGDSKPSSSNFRNYGSLEMHEPPKVILEKSNDTYGTASVDEIDRIVKKYADILLHTLEGVSSRLSQLEGRTHSLESAVDDLKLSVDNSSGSTDGKLRQLENILIEVQTGVQVVRDKQEIAEAQMQPAKLQATEGDHQPPHNSNIALSNSQQPHMPLPQQPLQQPAQPSAAPPPPPPLQIPALPVPAAPNAPPPPPPPQQNLPPQFSSQVPQHQVSSISSAPPREPYFPPGQPPKEVHQQHYQPPTQQTQVPLLQHYQPTPQLAQYSQPPQPPQPVGPPQLQPSLPHHPEESSPYMPPSQTYPPSIHQPPQLQTGPPPQQIYGSATNIYETPTSRPASGQQPFPPGYGPASGPSFSDSYPYSGSPSPYSSAREPSPFPPPPAPSSGSTYPRLPTAKLLPQTLPTASGSGGSSGSSGNRVPVDDVVDRVTTMGFSRDMVRATVKKLTENGQSVDLNTVLDKLTNDSENQPRKAWFGR